MKPILTQKQSFSLDKKTIELGYLEESQLLDNVGKKIAQFILEKIKNPFNNKTKRHQNLQNKWNNG